MENLAFLEYARIYYSDKRQECFPAPCLSEPVLEVRKPKPFRATCAKATLLVGLATLPNFHVADIAIALRREDSGPSVEILQRQLATAGFYNGPFTEYYGEMTESSVIQFQRANGLVADGIVGPATLSLLNGSVTQDDAPVSGGPSNGVLKRGSRGPSVVQIQDQLRIAGFFTDNSTGYFGSQTEAAVVQFQRSRGLGADGVVGPATLAALGQGRSSMTQATGSTILRKGSIGPDVNQLQEQLKANGFFQGNTTDYFGDQTEQAVITFQNSRGLTADGIVGPATRSALVSNGRAQSVGSAGTGGGLLRPSQQVQPGVMEMQRLLRDRGYYANSIDGVYGSRTVAAVQQFQRDYGLVPDGIFGPQTAAALNNAGSINGDRGGATGTGNGSGTGGGSPTQPSTETSPTESTSPRPIVFDDQSSGTEALVAELRTANAMVRFQVGSGFAANELPGDGTVANPGLGTIAECPKILRENLLGDRAAELRDEVSVWGLEYIYANTPTSLTPEEQDRYILSRVEEPDLRNCLIALAQSGIRVTEVILNPSKLLPQIDDILETFKS